MAVKKKWQKGFLPDQHSAEPSGRSLTSHIVLFGLWAAPSLAEKNIVCYNRYNLINKQNREYGSYCCFKCIK